MSTGRPLRLIMQDQALLHVNRHSRGLVHAYLVRVPFCDRPFMILSPPLPPGCRLIKAEDLGHDPVIHPLGDRLRILAQDQADYPGQAGAILLGPDPMLVRACLEQVTVTPRIAPGAGSPGPESSPAQGEYQTLEIAHGDLDLQESLSQRRVQTSLDIASLPYQDVEERPVKVDIHEDSLNLELSHPWPHLVRKAVSEATGLSLDQVRVRNGTSYQLKPHRLYQGLVTAGLAALAARVAGTSLLLHWTGQNQINHAWRQIGGTIRILSYHDAMGTLLGLKAQADLDGGASAPGGGEILHQLALSFLAVYGPVPYRIEARMRLSPQAPRHSGLGLGEHLGQLAQEFHWSRVSRIFGINPLSWRLDNLRLVTRGPGDLVFDDSIPEAQACLSKLKSLSDFLRRHAAYRLQNNYARSADPAIHRIPLDHAYPGIGLALAYQSGHLVSLERSFRPQIRLTLGADGHLEVWAPFEPGNMSLRTAWVRLIAQETGINPRNITLSPLDTERLPDPGPLVTGRQYSLSGPLLAKAIRLMKAQVREGRKELTLEVDLDEDLKPWWDPVAGRGRPLVKRTWGAAAVDLELSRYSGRVLIKHVWVCVHTGSFIPESRAMSILENGIRENLQLSGGPNLESRDGDFPIHITLLPSETAEPGDLGSLETGRGVETLPSILIPAAYLNALSQATSRPLSQFPPHTSHYLEEISDPGIHPER